MLLTLILWLLSAVIFPLLLLTNTFYIFNYWLLLAALIIIGYFTYTEGKWRETPGKRLIRIKVTALEGEMDYRKAFIRNLSKIYWLPLLFDVFIGWIIGDTKRRFLDKIANTVVVESEEDGRKFDSI